MKILHLKNVYVKLPDSFDGTLADALYILYKARAKSEQLNKITKVEIPKTIQEFLNDENITYALNYTID